MIMRFSRQAPTSRSALVGFFLAGIVAGCGKNGQPVASQPAASIPLPEHPLIAPCEPGIPGGRLVIATFGDPKTFNPIMYDEQGSKGISRVPFNCLLNFAWPTQQASPRLA